MRTSASARVQARMQVMRMRWRVALPIPPPTTVARESSPSPRSIARGSLLAEDDAPLGQVVGGEFDLDAVAGEDADEVLAHLARDDPEDLLPAAVELELEHGVGQRRDDGGFDFNCFGLGHSKGA